MRWPAVLPLALIAACATERVVVAEAPPSPVPTSAAVPPSNGSLWNQEPQSFFGNRRARNVGDILTVIVEIDDQAEIGNELSRQTSTEQSFGIGALFGLPQWASGKLPGDAGIEEAVDLSRSQSRQGNGNLRREDKVTLRLAARVVDRMPNGDLVIDGNQSVRVNYEERMLRASGIVRPEDITRDNTITHDKIAEAEIGYVGRGAIDRTVRPRLGDRILDAVIPF